MLTQPIGKLLKFNYRIDTPSAVKTQKCKLPTEEVIVPTISIGPVTCCVVPELVLSETLNTKIAAAGRLATNER